MQQQLEQRQSADGGSVPPTPGAVSEGGWHFICECFFMTLKALHLGVIKVVDELTDGPMYWHMNQMANAQQEAQALVERCVFVAAEKPAVCVCCCLGGGH